jgi:hypothetical protein
MNNRLGDSRDDHRRADPDRGDDHHDERGYRTRSSPRQGSSAAEQRVEQGGRTADTNASFRTNITRLSS